MNTQESSSRFAPSARLGPYEIVGPVGKGGMGEVYRAKDTRLEREVAIKILPPGLGNDEQFRARFEREAKSVSALNHPHICTLHDVGQETVKGETLHYIVLEMIEGESLAARIARAPLSLEEVLLYGKQIASALDAAHKRGIIHRDLKPGNVMITKAGAKLLDFGLAKSGDRGVVQGVTAIETYDTIDKPLTEQGTIMGTFQYMSPEQLEGAPADSRTDIFALGAVLYEMATGKKAFEGKNRTSLIAAIVSSQPAPISAVQGMSPPALDHVVRKCIEKDPDDRWQSARDVAAELQWIAEGGSRAGIPVAVSSRRRHRENAAWLTAALLGVLAIGFAIAWMRRAPAPLPVVRFMIPNPENITGIGSPVVSPDGRTVAFHAANANGVTMIWIRQMDALEPRSLPGTEGGQRPFWSPDSKWIAFTGGGKLRKVAISGGPPQTICDTQTGSDGSWSKDGVILFDGQDNDPVWRVDAGGGVPKIEIPQTKESGVVGWPAFLPDGRHYLYMSSLTADSPTLMVRSLDKADATPLFKTTSRVAYAPPGYLLYIRDNTLVAQAFDASAMKTTGDPFPIGEGLGIDNVGGASFSLSENGVLAFRAGERGGQRMLWFDRNGRESMALTEIQEYGDTAFSPDGKRIAYDLTGTAGNTDIWIRDLTRGVNSRFTFDKEREFCPVWSPDGRRIVYSRANKAAWDLYVKDASGTGEPELLLESQENKFVTDWTKDGRYIIYANAGKEAGWDMYALPMTGEKKPIPLVKTRFQEHGGVVSPDGRYLVYRSNESGQNEVYVQEFPEARSKFQVSTNGGVDPFWRGDGREIFYRTRDRKIMAVPVQPGPAFATGTPVPLFEATFAAVNARGLYRPAADGQRFLVISPIGREALPPATIVMNWSAAPR
ncbi:MAG: serine/threonine-protein kinase [Vicinamibacteria bacterium]|nr:serine/threonine-protein kinase [Vicinamibacteria bacterium]